MPYIPRHIKEVNVVDLMTDSKETLTTRQNSACHFFEPIRVGSTDVQLRLDWTDLEDGEPRLDADFIDSASGKHLQLVGERRVVHRTTKQVENTTGKRVYEFTFQSLAMRVEVTVTNARTITGKAFIAHFATQNLPGTASIVRDRI